MEILEHLLLALLPAGLCLWAYRQGIRDGMAKESGIPPEPVARAKGKPRGQTAEERRMQQIMADVEAYDGTSRGQKEVV